MAMKPSYLCPPGYKQTEVGAIPEDWNAVPIGQLLAFKNGLNKAKRFFGAGTPIVNYMDVFQNSGLTTKKVPGKVTVTLQERRNYSAKAGDVFFTRTSETVDEIGISSALLENMEGAVFSGFVLRGRPVSDSLGLSFKKYCFSQESVRKQIRKSASYTTRALTNGTLLSKVLIPLPPTIAEQEAIAEALSDADTLIESLEKLIAKKRQLKQGAMQELLTGKKRLPGFEVKSGYKQTEVGVIPQDWKVKSLSDVFSFSGGFSASRAQLGDSGYCYLHYGDIHTSSKSYVDVDAQYVELPKLDVRLGDVPRKSILLDGDVVFVDASEDDEGTSKHQVIRNPRNIPFISGLHTIVAKNKRDDLENGYKCHCFHTRSIKKQFLYYSVGTKVSGISKTNIGKILLPIPSVAEQEAIAVILSDMDSEIAALEAKLAKARHLKQGMMQELLTGRIRLV